MHENLYGLGNNWNENQSSINSSVYEIPIWPVYHLIKKKDDGKKKHRRMQLYKEKRVGLDRVSFVAEWNESLLVELEWFEFMNNSNHNILCGKGSLDAYLAKNPVIRTRGSSATKSNYAMPCRQLWVRRAARETAPQERRKKTQMK